MAMNPTDVLQYIELNLGASIQVLELSPDEIMEVVFTQTLPSFSTYYPNYQLIEIIPKRDKVPNRFNTFYIKCNEEILGVSKVLAENYMGNSGLPLAYYDSDPINRQFTADLASMYLQPITFDFETPNIISVYPKTNLLGAFTIQVKTIHPRHLATIPLSMRNEFLECALYDVRIALYPIRDRFKTINTTFGSVELFMDKLESASDDKKTLMEKWRANFHKSAKKRKMFIA
jgi:hypothetical protein